ncbi:MAG: GNAT family N-acetyltransferase [Candidatus Omnitrophica bacterium]|nr:GNAT family N-acetyltransferase [Candidatus Omnitrophota bacterium]
MKENITIRSNDNGSCIMLRSAKMKDSEKLRRWKNKNSKYFFHKNIIKKAQQIKWMKDYFSDKNNFMFIIKYKNTEIGCIGFRKRSDGADIYNVILAHNGLARKGLMTEALNLLFGFIKIRFKNIGKVYVKVLKSNKVAVLWYKKNCFKKTGNFKDAHFMVWQGCTCAKRS